MNKYFCVFILILAFGTCEAENSSPDSDNHITQEEGIILDTFFRYLIEETEMGYVLFDKKPLFVDGYFKEDPLTIGTPLHKSSVAISEGVFLWKKFLTLSSNVILFPYNKYSISSENSIDIIVINRELLKDTIQKNISLFQFVLGPSVDANNLIEALLIQENNFESVLKNDKTLIGILLGYGTTNAIFGSRSEILEEILFNSFNEPPFQNLSVHGSQINKYHKNLLLLSKNSNNSCSITALSKQPSFGFKNLVDEYNQLNASCTCATPNLMNNKPPFIYGCYSENNESTQLFHRILENTQIKIQELLNSENFLEDVLKIVTNKKYSWAEKGNQQLFIQKNNHDFNLIIAKAILIAFADYNKNYENFLVDGMRAPIVEENISGPLLFFPEYKECLEESRNNLLKADLFFNKISVDQSFKPVVPLKVYYRIIKEGAGQTLTDEKEVEVEYQILSSDNQCIATNILNSDSKIYLNKTIIGFSLGLKGMKIGETREIFIHPSLAYGAYTLNQKGAYLKSVVTLKNVNKDSRDSEVIEIKPIDMSFLFDPTFEEKFALDFKKAAQLRGNRIAQHFANSNLINLQVVLKFMDQLKYIPRSFLSLSEDERKILNRIHWNIYFGND